MGTVKSSRLSTYRLVQIIGATSVDQKWKGKAAMANPLFGTTATHTAVMYTILGPRKSKDLYKQMVSNHIRIVDGNSIVRDMVARGEVLWGLTDTDDVNVGILSGMPIKAVLPDQDGDGALLIPNTVSLIANAPHPREAKLLIDFLLSEETERVLCQSDSVQIPLRGNIPVPKGQCTLDDIISLKVDYEEIANAMTDSTKMVQNIFLK